MLHLEQRHFKIISEILSKFPYKLYAFGSRTKGTYRKLSDLDLCYVDTIPLRDLIKLEEELEDSDLPFKVEIIDYNHCSESFQNKIKKDMTPLSF